VQYESGKPLTRVRDPRLQAVFRRLLARFEITEPVFLCADIPLEQKNFAETVRRSDGRAVVAISNLLVEFTDEEITGMLAHELAHLLAGDPERPRPATTDEYLQEERDADIKAAELVGREAMCAAVRRAYRMSVALGFESKANVLRNHRDRRLKWIMNGRRCFESPD
jgi:Zn-dependent protease with chaperone function